MERRSAFLRCALLLILAIALAPSIAAAENGKSNDPEPGEGALLLSGKNHVPIPLKKTDVKISIIGFLASVDVVQTFSNPYKEKIEALYIFPLPSESAVDDMEINIGNRIIRSVVREREQARREYENARNNGYRAALLEQQRPNVFTTTVANIEPSKNITVRIHYIQRLDYDDGGFRLTFPMVTAPRYTPAGTLAKQIRAESIDVPLITPPILSPDYRPGTEISLSVEIDSGFSIKELHSISHEIKQEMITPTRYKVQLANSSEIPNKDFILEYKIAGKKPQAAVLQAVGEDGEGYFLMMASPPATAEVVDTLPKEMILIIDTSGSMEGQKLKLAQKALRICLDGLNSQDSFNIIKFSTGFKPMAEASLPFTTQSVELAERFIDSLSIDGGTEMLPPLLHALQQKQSDRVRMVIFFTDGQVGNETEILQEVKNNLGNSRIFAFGIDTAVNEYFLKKLAQLGRGTAHFLFPGQQDIESTINRFKKNISSPLLTDFSIDWSGLSVSDVSPDPLPDLYFNQPVFITGKLRAGIFSTVQVQAKNASGTISLPLTVDTISSLEMENVVAGLWARYRIERLADQMIENPEDKEIKDEIVKLAIEHRLVSPFTSFVALDQKLVTAGGRASQVTVPALLPSGWSSANATKLGSLSSLRMKRRQIPPSRSAAGKNNDSAKTVPESKTAAQNCSKENRSKANKLPATACTPKCNRVQPEAVRSAGRTDGITQVLQIAISSSLSPATSPAATAAKPEPAKEDSTNFGLDINNTNSVLNYLARRQTLSGAWGQRAGTDTLHATSLAALVFISSGRAANHSGYRHQLQCALSYIASNMDQEGMLRGIGEPGQTEVQAIALWSLTEGMRSFPSEYKNAAEFMLNGLLKLRCPDGFWPSQEGGEKSITATAWAALALSSCAKAGIGGGEQLQEIANLVAARDKNQLEHRFILLLAGRAGDSTDIEKMKNRLLAQDLSSGKAMFDKAFFAMSVLRRTDASAYSTLESQIRSSKFDSVPSISSLAMRYLALTALH
jgi:Ca-activated chloride channel homolog